MSARSMLTRSLPIGPNPPALDETPPALSQGNRELRCDPEAGGSNLSPNGASHLRGPSRRTVFFQSSM
ncbi:unnamed protein product, partial [Mycena citricolor]